MVSSSSAMTIEEWEAMVPLGELEMKSVNVIKAACERRPRPAKFNLNLEPSCSSTPRPSSAILVSSRPATPLSTSISTRSPTTHELDPKQPIQTPQQFYDWFALIDRSVAHSQEAHFRAHAASVKGHLDICQQLLEKIELVDREVETMMEAWRGVEEGGRSLKDACEKLLEERDKLLEITDEMDARLEYFQELDHATRMLNYPGESLVLQTDFLYMVERVDVCIDYLKAHRHYREAEIYLFRYQQCMTRAMTLIKMYFVGSLRALCLDVSRRLSEKDVSPTAQAHLLYTRFATVSQQLLPLLNEFERRARAHPQELFALLSECHSAYFAARKSLLVARVTAEIKGLDPGRTEIVELTRSGCSYLKQLCTDEFDLYRKFFNSGEDQLYQYLETLCDYLYDDLRPRILHEPRLTALCEVCTVLQALIVLDGSSLPSDSDSDAEDATDDNITHSSPSSRYTELTMDLDQAAQKRPHGVGKSLHISHLLQMVLQDAQTRLFFKAQAVVQSDVRYYIPKPEDLKWPDVILDARNPSNPNGASTELREKESVNKMFGSRSMDQQETWYPTLRKTVWVLEQLRDFVKPAIFEDIAQEAINLCRQSLVAASDMIIQRNGSQLDGLLFLVRHLMILKDVGKNSDLTLGGVGSQGSGIIGGASGSAAEAVGLGITDTLATMLSRTTSLFPDALFSSLGMPRAEESIKEAQHSTDHELRRACEAIISQCAEPIMKPLLDWTDQMRSYAPREARSPSLTPEQQEWPQPSAAAELDVGFRRACETDLRAAIGKLKLYLEEERTVRVLAEHVVERLMDAYAGFAEVMRRLYSGASGDQGFQVMSVGKARVFLDEICRG